MEIVLKKDNRISDNVRFNGDAVLKRAIKKRKLLGIFGERGKGKTYWCKGVVIQHYLRTGKKFLWLRTTVTQVKQMTKGNEAWIADISKVYPDLSQDGVRIFYKNQQIGMLASLSQASLLKGSSWDDYDIGVVDEITGVIKEKYDVGFAFFDVLESVFRDRDGVVILTSNTITKDNWFFENFNIHPSLKDETGVFENDKVILHIDMSKAYIEAKKKTFIGQLMDGTSYGAFAMENKFIMDDESGVVGDVVGYKFKFIIIAEGKYFGVWEKKTKQGDMLHISKKYNPNCKVKITFTGEDIEQDSTKGNDTMMLNMFYLFFTTRMLTFDKQSTKNRVIELCRKNYTKF